MPRRPPLNRPGARRTYAHPWRFPKEQGEFAEIAFLYRAAQRGLTVLRPFGDSRPYDLVVDNGHRLLRVQIKSVCKRYKNFWRVNLNHGFCIRRPYTAKEFDFLAAWVIPEDTWYIFPVPVVAGKQGMYVGGSRHAIYKEAWNQLFAANADRSG